MKYSFKIKLVRSSIIREYEYSYRLTIHIDYYKLSNYHNIMTIIIDPIEYYYKLTYIVDLLSLQND